LSGASDQISVYLDIKHDMQQEYRHDSDWY